MMDFLTNNAYLLKMEFRNEKIESFSKYPFNLPFIKETSNIEFSPRVTFL